MKEENFSRKDRETLHKWGKARKILDENRIDLLTKSDELYIFEVEGDSETYRVGVDIGSGESYCPCPFVGNQCSHQIAVHVKLSRLGVEDEHH